MTGPFEHSIHKIANRDVGRGEGAVRNDHEFNKLRNAVTILCRRMEFAVPTMLPCEVMAILGIVVRHEHTAFAHVVLTRVLLRMGWSAAQSAQFYKNFRNANPDPFDMRLAPLLTRQQLRSSYGPTYGDVIADVLVDPRTFPLLHSMLFGNIMEPVQMVFRTAFVPMILQDDLLFNSSDDAWLHQLPIPAMTSDELEGHYVDHDTAKRLYEGATGGSLATSLTLSTNDHGIHQTTKTKKAVRQANRGQSLRP